MKDLAKYFLKLGSTGFGGPIAMIGMMEQHFVHREKSVSEVDFRRYVAAAKLFPGALATLIAIRVGFEKKGRWGGFIAGFCQVFPAFLIVLALSHYLIAAKENSNPIFSMLFTGLNLGGLALSTVAAFRFSLPLISSQTFFYFFATALLTFFYPREEIFFLLACGGLSLLYHRYRNHVFEVSTILLSAIFYESFKASLFTYGTGIAMVPVLKSVYIDHYHWITESDFLTGLSVGQMTPGPLIIFNTFLAKQVAGIPGAIAATFGIFIPTFIFGLWIMPAFEKKLINTQSLKIFFSGMLPAVGGAIAGSVIRLCMFALKDGPNHILLFALLIGIAYFSKLHPIAILFTSSLLTVLGFLVGIIQ